MKEAQIADNLSRVRNRIQLAAQRAGRDPALIELIAVSKKQSVNSIRAAYQAGQRIFGENYLQEAVAKINQLADLDLTWHFIGRIQTNKIRALATHFTWIHGLTEINHAYRLNEQRTIIAKKLNVCIQVNLDGAASKNGVAPSAVINLLQACQDLPWINLCGLMTLPTLTIDEIMQRQAFRALNFLREQLAALNYPLPYLSMGMSDDLESAILEGANLVRVGTAIFGSRQ